jgi:TolB-like protein
LPQVAVLRTAVSPGIDPTVADPITEKIIEALVVSGKYLVLDRLNIERVLAEKELQFSSSIVSQSEMRRAGEYLGADFVIFASISRVGSTHILSCKMVDVTTGAIAAQVSEERKGNIDVLLDAARAVGERIAGAASGIGTGTGPRADEGITTILESTAQAPVSVSADLADLEGDYFFEVRDLLDERAFLSDDGSRKISSLAKGIDENKRAKLYESYQAGSPVGYSALNFILPSIGSWTQGDIKGALIIDAVMVPPVVAAIILGPIKFVLSVPQGLILAGAGVLVADLIGIVRPFSYASDYNKDLKKALLVTADPNLRLASLSDGASRQDAGLRILLWRLEI